MSRKPSESKKIANFWAKVDKSGECWEWQGTKDHAGYGKSYYNGRGKQCMAHRLSYELTFGAIPDDMYVLHKCDNRACVNPFHLYAGNQFDNMRDMEERGRGNHPKGEGHYAARLSAADVRTIKARVAGGEPIRRVAREYGIDRKHVYNIRNGVKWKDV